MRLIDRGANYQLRLPTLELREQEIMNMYQSNPGRSCPLKVFPRRKPDIPQFSRQELSNSPFEKSLGHFSDPQNL